MPKTYFYDFVTDFGGDIMVRDVYIPYIVEKFSLLEITIKLSGKLNLTNIHIHAEAFFSHLFNILYDSNYENTNIDTSNEEAIDLKDEVKKSVIQVTSNKTKRKIENTLSKPAIEKLKEDGFSLQFVMISSDCKNLKSNIYINPHNISFIPTKDILDLTDILRRIENLDIDKLVLVYEFFRKEFGDGISQMNTSRNLPVLLNLLAKENLSTVKNNLNLNTYKINEKITYNHLDRIKNSTIERNKIYVGLLDKLYKQFDEQGMNKSISVFNKLSFFYEDDLINGNTSNITIFFNVINKTIAYIKSSANYKPIPDEELELCVRIIVVDAFIRCKIFENPGGYSYVTSN